MDNFVFKNLDTNSDIAIPIGSRFTYVYGGNGTGKTTFSRQFLSGVTNSKVFNVDFINKNVYIVDTDGAKMDSSTKDNFSKLFISEQAVVYANEMMKAKEIKKSVEILKEQSISRLNQLLKNYHLDSNFEFEKITAKLKTSRLEFNYMENIETNKSNINFSNALDTELQNDQDLATKISQYRANDIMKKIHEIINNTNTLKEIFIDNVYIDNINNLLFEYNAAVEYIRIIEKDFDKTKNSQLFKDWIEVGLKLHESQTTCLFCGREDIEPQIYKWKEIIENKKGDIKKSILARIKKSQEDIYIIISSKSVYESVIPLIISTLEKLLEQMSIIEREIIKNSIVEPIVIRIEKDLTEIKIEETYNEIIAYLLNKDLIGYFFPFYYFNYLQIVQTSFENKANIESEKFSKSTNEAIDSVAKKLGLEKDLKIFIETRKGSIPKMSIGPAKKTVKIGTFSEGQIHKLALAIFFADILMKKEVYDYLVLDDPMISLDVVAYHKLKSFIIFDLNDKFKKSIILTHNISFLLIMLSNLIRDIDKRKDTTLVELKPNNYHIIPIETIAKDDIVLFIDAINNSIDIDDVSLWYWMIEKIARHFMDIKLSLMGKVSFNDVNKDLSSIFHSPDLEVVKTIHNQIIKTSKNTKTKIEDIKIALENLNRFSLKLGFPIIINESSLLKFKEKFNDDMIVLEQPMAKNLEYSILKEGHRIVFDSSKENAFLKDYIMHPRHQVTESLVAFEAQLDK